MTFDELFDKIDGKEFEGLGLKVDLGEPMIVLRHMPTALITQVPVDCVKKMDWDQLHPVLTGQREPKVLEYTSRICGYYSRMSQWNQSKIGELKDRHKGNYAIQEVSASA